LIRPLSNIFSMNFDIKGFLRNVQKFVRKIIEIQIRFLLFVVYFLIFAFLGILTKIFRDYLEIKSSPRWYVHQGYKDIWEFLRKQ